MLSALPTVASYPDFEQQHVIQQYEEFKRRNQPVLQGASTAIVDTSSASGANTDAEARFAILETPITKLKKIIEHVERPVQPGEDRKKVDLTKEQLLACATFAQMVNVAWEEERAQVPLDQRKCQQMILLGQGGTGKTMIVTEITTMTVAVLMRLIVIMIVPVLARMILIVLKFKDKA